MLQSLSVKNYVLIDSLELSFGKKLTIISGETGAGKSILLGALGLILGQRADSDSLLKKDQKCIVEGVFSIREYHLSEWFDAHELDYQYETSIRREINVEGKSRAFINDTPVNLNLLKELAVNLVDIHSQHETLSLNNSTFQLSVVDAYADNGDGLTNYKSIYKKYFSVLNELNVLIEAEQKGKADADYFQFQFNELDEARLQEGEQESLEQIQKRLTHAEEIRGHLSKAYAALYGEEGNLVNTLSVIQQQVASLLRYENHFEDLSNRLKSTLLELKDIADELEKAEQEINLDPNKLLEVEDRLSLLYKLQQKHHAASVNELLKLREEFSEKLQQLGSFEDKINAKKLELEALHNNLLKGGEQLSIARKNAIPSIEKEIGKQLAELGMPHAILRIAIHPSKENHFLPHGLENIQFLFSANKGIDFRELNKVASGGELSRLMLCIKSLLAKLSAMPTVIFDEIDTGVSGETASRIGSILKLMSNKHQVIAITHLPQIASKGDDHFLVYKEVKKGMTRTHLRLLEKEERIQEVARMLSGEKLTDAAIINARELLSAN